MSRKNKFDTLLITDKILRYGSYVYQISNLTHAGKYEVKGRIKWFTSLTLSVLIAACFFGGISLYEEGFRHNSVEMTLLSFIVIGMAILLFLLLKKIGRRKEHALALETNSGSVQLLSSKNENFIADLVSIIAKIMDSQILQANYTANIKSANIYDNSTGQVVMGDNFSNIGANASIYNRVSNTSINQMTNTYGEDFVEALQQLAKHTSTSNDISVVKSFNNFENEIIKKDSSKTTLRILWDNLERTLPSIEKVASSVKIIRDALS